jgi:hypothetical protein
VVIGLLLYLLPLAGSGGTGLNLAAGLLAILLGVGVIGWTRRYAS